jgi:hypothetical protein
MFEDISVLGTYTPKAQLRWIEFDRHDEGDSSADKLRDCGGGFQLNTM